MRLSVLELSARSLMTGGFGVRLSVLEFSARSLMTGGLYPGAYIPFLKALPCMMKQWICVLSLSMFLFVGGAGLAQADSVTLIYFFEGIDFDTGQVYHDPTILIVIQGRVKDVDTLLKPPNFAQEFSSVVDAYFEFTPYSEFIPQYGTSLVFLPDQDTQAPNRIVQFALLEDIPLDQSAIPPPEDFSDILEPIFLDPADTLVLLTAAGDYLKIGHVVQDGFQVQVQIVKPAIPEPAPLLLLGLGLAGLAGLRRQRRKAGGSKKHINTQNSWRLLLLIGFMTGVMLNIAQPVVAQSFECSSVSEIPEAECEALVALYTSTDGDNWTQNDDWLQTDTPCNWYGVTCEAGHVSKLILLNSLLKGNIPSELGNLSNLQELWLNHNQLSGNIPLELGNLTNLQTLWLEYNQLNGNIPPELGKLSNLQKLRLEFNHLSGSVPPELGNLVNLQRLNLGVNHLSGNIPSELGNLANLQRLYLGWNELSGNIPMELGNLTKLKELSLDYNHLSGNIPPELGNLSNLQTLCLRYNQLSGYIPSEFGTLTEVRSLYLDYNPLTGPLPETLMNLTKLGQFYFNETHLCEPADPTFQSWLSSIPSLSKTGVTCTPSICDTVTEIPSAECDALVTLFEGTDGDNWTDNTDWLSTNTPCTWYGVTCDEGHVTRLDLQNNQLSGELPAELQNLDNLEAFYLNNNSLTGSLPTHLVSLTALQTFSFQDTEMCEPQDTIFQEWLDSITALQHSGKVCEVYTCDLVTEIPQTECEALVTFYNSTNGNYWSNNTNWLKTDTPCDWYGVTCSTGHVTGLDLRNNLLSGSIPSELDKLKYLQTLILFCNQLNGSIPQEIGKLTTLQSLALSVNYLSGDIPQELGDLINLQLLNFGRNQLSGNIPPELGNLTNLQYLNLQSNQLSGNIPSELGSLSNLQTLWLHDNQLMGNIPPELGSLSNLQNLWLMDNQLSGNISPELGNLINLQDLSLHDNQLSGSIPPELGNLNNLRNLSLFTNQLSGSIPPELGNLANLQDLQLGINQLSGISPELGNLNNLRNLYLYANQLSGNIPWEISKLAKLRTLSLYWNQLSGTLPDDLINLTQLQSFDFHDTNLCEPQDAEFHAWLTGIEGVQSSGLTCLDSGVCESVAEIPQTECEALVALYNNTSGDKWTNNSNWGETEMPCSSPWYGVTCDTEHVTQIDLNTNQLSGNIPPELGDLTNLQHIFLHTNELSGGIPPDLGNLSNLQSLYLHTNQLSGTIPSTLGNLSNLQVLDLYINDLSGSIPPELGNLANVQYLNLYSNQLSGNIPPELGKLTNVIYLRLRDNQLSGSIPPELGNLTNLQYLHVGKNPLSGSLPENLTNLSELEKFYFNETNLCEPQDATFQHWLAEVEARNPDQDDDVQGTEVACTNYFSYDDTWYDADQGETNLCWAAAASNTLAWTGWHGLADPVDEQAIFSVFQNNWIDSEENNGGLMNFAWEWWFSGTTEPPTSGDYGAWAQPLRPPNPLPEPEGGGYWPGVDFSQYFQTASGVSVMTNIDTYLRLGYGVTITAYPDPEALGHAFTIWGFEYDADEWITSLWMTDSDDAERRLFRFPVTYDPVNKLWLLNDGSGTYDNWYIGSVLALEQRGLPQRFSIAALAVPGDVAAVGIDPASIVTVAEGQAQSFTITSDPASGHVLIALWVDGVDEITACQTSTGNCRAIAPGTWEYTFSSVDQHHTIQAIFQTASVAHTITADADAGGQISPAGTVYIETGGSRTFTITPDRGFRIKELVVDGDVVEPVTTYTFEEVSANHTILARFVENTVKLAITKKQCFDAEEHEIACGTVIDGKPVDATVWVGDKVAPPGTDVIVVPFTTARALILKAEPNEGSRFVRWEVNGKIVEGLIDVQHDLLLRPIIRHDACN